MTCLVTPLLLLKPFNALRGQVCLGQSKSCGAGGGATATWASRKLFLMVVTDVNPEVSKDESEVHPRRKSSRMVVTDVNPEVSKDESEVHP